MNIAHVVSTSPPYEGGMGTVAGNLVNYLRKCGHEADLLSPGNGLRPWFHYGNANVNPALLWNLQKYDVVHLHYAFFGGAEFVLFAKLFGMLKGKLVVHYHNDVVGVGIVKPIAWFDELFFLRPLFRRADAVIVLSATHLKHSKKLSQHYSVIQHKLHILPNGIDPERFLPREKHEELMARFQIPADSTVVMFTGAIDRAHYFKGVEDLMKAFQIARAKNAKLFLLIIGGGDRKVRVEALARNLLPVGSFVFTDRVSNQALPRFMSLGDMFVLPSYEVESFGIVLIEALACGKPVIASDLPALDEVVKDEFGIRFKRRDVDDLAAKILCMSERDLKAMGMAGREYVSQHFTWEKIVRKLEGIYQKIVS